MERHHESPHFKGLLVQEIEDSHIRPLAYLISKADNLSSSERSGSTGPWQDYKATPLASVLQRVQFHSSKTAQTAKPPVLRLHPRPLDFADLQCVFGDTFDRYEPNELNKLIKAFGDEFHQLAPQGGTSDFGVLLSHLLHLLYKYAWCVPSNTQEDVPDVSLFDHLRTTAAIAACLYQYHCAADSFEEAEIRRSTKERFCLVAGDLSGIQSYIFDIASIGVGGVARRLRARSLFVQLATESCARRVLKAFDLPPMNVLMSAGGNFYVLAPNSHDTASKLDHVQNEVDHWFLKHTNGELALNLACNTFGDEGFKTSPERERESGFGTVLKEVNESLARQKQQRFSRVLMDGADWREPSFTIDTDFGGEGACQACGKFPVESEHLCHLCRTDRDTGKDLPGAKFVAFFSDSRRGDISLPEGSASILAGPPGKGNPPDLVVKLNDTDLRDATAFPARSAFLATYIPKVRDEAHLEELRRLVGEKGGDDLEIGGPVTFEPLSKLASGRPLLGFLKADVDHLGELMVFGLKPALDTVSRLATLSRQLDWFFSGWIEHLTSREFLNCYTVFSGGDDLFLIGPWDSIIDLASQIHDDFARYTGNPKITLSAGILLAPHSYPIARASEDVNAALKQAKDGGRDRLTLLGHTLTWEEWEAVRTEWRKLSEKVAAEKVSSSFLYSLLEYGRMWQQYRKGDVLGLRFQPLLAYTLKRNLNQRQSPAFYQWAEGLITLRPGDQQQRRTLDNLGLLSQLLILGKEGGRE